MIRSVRFQSLVLRTVVALCTVVGLIPKIQAQTKDPLADRYVALRVAAPGDLTGDGILLDAAVPTLRLTAEFSLKECPDSAYLALFIASGRTVMVTVNDHRIQTDPVSGMDGDFVLIPPHLLRPSELNTISIQRQPLVPSTASWVGTALFALEPGEEIHFAENAAAAMGKKNLRPPTKNVTPPQHPNETKFDVVSYDLFVQPDMNDTASRITSAVMTMNAIATETLTVVPLDFDANTPASPQLIVSQVDSGPGTPALSWTQDGSNLRILVTLPAAVNPGQPFTVRVTYSGVPTGSFTGSLARPFTRTTHGSPAKPVVYTASQPYGARRWWPCKDRPDDKATTTTVRVCIPTGQGLSVVSNGLLAGIESGPVAGTETYVWKNTYNIPTYLVSFNVSDYVYTPEAVYTGLDGITTMSVRHAIYTENVASEGNGQLGTLQAINFFASKFGEYPFLREKYWTASWNITFGIEHQTATGMPGAAQIGVSGSVGDGTTRRNVHELSHQWYGDKITYRTFDHVWLGEGFATFAEALWQENVGGTAAYQSYVNNNFSLSSVLTLNTANPLVDPFADTYTGSHVYRRGAWVLHMLRGVLGDTKFFNAMKAWTKPPNLSEADSVRAADSADFETVVEQSSGVDLTTFFDQWLNRPNGDGDVFPNYRFEAYSRKVGSQYFVDIGIEQRQTGSVPFTMPLDIEVGLADNSTTIIRVNQSSLALTSFTLALGSVAPLTVDLDPDNWVLNNQSASVNTVGLPSVVTNASYSRALRSSSFTINGSAATVTWSAVSLPTWLSLSGSTLTGVAPATPGTYYAVVQFSSAGIPTRSVTLPIEVTAGPPPTPIPPVVINEVMYDPYPDATDAGEYIELYNSGTSPVDMAGWQLLLLDGSGAGSTYDTITFPPNAILGAGAYAVVGSTSTINAVYPGAVGAFGYDLDNALLQNVPSAIVLKAADGQRADTFRYRGDAVFSGPDAALATAESATGRSLGRTISNTTLQASVSRLPNGTDTGSNLLDFAQGAATPGFANASPVNAGTLPFIDEFNTLNSSAWRGAFVDPRVVDPTAAGKPGTAAPGNGGNVLEVYDASGGGDVAFVSARLAVVNFTGQIWTPQDVTNGWSTGVALSAGHDSGWFSNSNGFGLEHGFYLEYQNASVSMKGGEIPGHAGSVKLWSVNASPSVGVGASSAVATELGSLTLSTGQKNTWNSFRLGVDRPGNRLIASFAGSLLYDGPLPSGVSWPTGFTPVVGFRENHTGAPSSANREGTWIDAMRLDQLVPAQITAFDLE